MYVTEPLVPPAVVAVTFTAPAAWAGVVAVIWVPAPLTDTPVAAVPPKDTLAPARLVPVNVTAVPPAVVPELGAIVVSAGVAGAGLSAELPGYVRALISTRLLNPSPSESRFSIAAKLRLLLAYAVP